MIVRTETANFDMKKLLMVDRLSDGTVLVILEASATDARDGRRAPGPQRRLTLTGVCADQAWSQVMQHAATLAGRTVGSDADC